MGKLKDTSPETNAIRRSESQEMRRIAFVGLFVIGFAFGASALLLGRNQPQAPAEAGAGETTPSDGTPPSGGETVSIEGFGVAPVDNPCAVIPAFTAPENIPEDFQPQHSVQHPEPTASAGEAEGSESLGAAPIHTIWTCNPEPGLYVKVDIDTGQVIAVDFEESERTSIGEAITATVENAFQSTFRVVDLPTDPVKGCQTEWTNFSFDGITGCVPADWAVIDTASEPNQCARLPVSGLTHCGVDLLVESRDGSVFVLIEPGIGLRQVGVRECENAANVAGPLRTATVCSVREDLAQPPVLIYGFVLDTGRYAQITVVEGTEQAIVSDAMAVILNVN